MDLTEVRTVLEEARRLAQEAGAPVGVLHLLLALAPALGLPREGLEDAVQEETAGKDAPARGVDPEVRSALERAQERAGELGPLRALWAVLLAFSPRARQALARAYGPRRAGRLVESALEDLFGPGWRVLTALRDRREAPT